MKTSELIFEPISRSPSAGNELQCAETNYKGVRILEFTFFPWSPFKNISVWYMVDLVLPMGTIPSLVADKYYTEEGFGVPEVKTIEQAIEVVENFKNNTTK